MRVPKRSPRPTWLRPDHDPDEFQASLVDHLEELRTRIIRSLLVVTAAWVLGWFLQPYFYAAIDAMTTKYIIPNLPKGSEYREKFNNVTEPFMLKMRLSFSIGLFFAIPFVIRQIWGFVAPGLKPKEQEPFRKLAPWTVVLFILGAAMSLAILPATLIWFADYLGEFKGASLYQDAGSMSYFVIKMATAFGIGFQVPIVVYALSYLGLLSAGTLMKYWRHAATFIFIAAAIITPSNDPFSMLMMAIPMTLLFAGSVWAVRRLPARARDDEDESDEGDSFLTPSTPVLVTPDAVIPRGPTTVSGAPITEEVSAPRDDA